MKRRVPFDFATRQHILLVRMMPSPENESPHSVDYKTLTAATNLISADLILMAQHTKLYPGCTPERCAMVN